MEWSPSSVANARAYTVNVTLKGNYSGSGSATYTVNKKSITPTVTLSKTKATHGDSDWNTLPTVTVTGDSKTL